MRILVLGSDDWMRAQIVQHELDLAASRIITQHEGQYLKEGIVVVAGASPRGIDALVRLWCEKRMDCDLEEHTTRVANTKRSPTARDIEMVGLGAEICLAFMSVCLRKRCREKQRQPHGDHRVAISATHAEVSGIETRRHYGWRS